MAHLLEINNTGSGQIYKFEHFANVLLTVKAEIIEEVGKGRAKQK